MKPESILFVRRDNIGDLICTTPAIRAVRREYPGAKIGVLVNTYNADAIVNNPDIDKLYVYEKFKHAGGKGRLKVWASNLRLILKIRKEKYNVAIACGHRYSPRLARYAYFTGAGQRIGYITEGERPLYYNLPVVEPSDPVHEVISTFNLLKPLGIKGNPPEPVLRVDDRELEMVSSYMNKKEIDPDRVVVLHISTRKAENRWPKERFLELAERMAAGYHAHVIVLWAPGDRENPYHPGDDMAAKWIERKTGEEIYFYPTKRLSSLIAVISQAKLVICMDGGAMHIAAALGKPIVALWGSTDRKRWAPWGARHIILQKKGSSIRNITLQDVLSAFERLWDEGQGIVESSKL